MRPKEDPKTQICVTCDMKVQKPLNMNRTEILQKQGLINYS